MNQYNMQEFTLKEYERLICIAKNRGYSFKLHKEIDRMDNNFIIWRHDVDFSLEQSFLTAQIENNYQIKSTYFIHLHNDLYNALDFDSKNLIKNIISLGHSIGLHFDCNYYDIVSSKKLNYWLEYEKNILENLVQQEIFVFSFHNPNKHTMTLDDDTYGGMINTYSKYFKNEVHYCSDSNGYWRYRKLEEVLHDPKVDKLQVLTHPGWWTRDELMPREKIIRYANRRKEKIIENYDEMLKISGRVNLC